MRALIAFDKFKDALSAEAACETAATALPALRCDCCPLTDGGEGFCAILTSSAAGRFVERSVTGSRGAPVAAGYGIVSWSAIPTAARAMMGLDQGPAAKVAIIEMARASGLALLPSDQRDPWQTTSRGTGQLIRAAAAEGASAIVLGVGGSATHDLGLGALAECGVNGSTTAGAMVDWSRPAGWSALTQLDARLTINLPPLFIACDVTNPLLGPLGAASVYAPQKGLCPENFEQLETLTRRVAERLCQSAGADWALTEIPGAGAAGGIAFGLMCTAGARLLPGFDFVSAWFDLDARLAAADLILTGEGRFDDSSMHGKGPGSVARRGLQLKKPVHVFAGQIDLSDPPPELHLHALTAPGTTLPDALRATRANLADSVRRTFA